MAGGPQVWQLLKRVPRQRVITCSKIFDHGTVDVVTLEAGTSVSLDHLDFPDVERCLVPGTEVEKRRWEYGYRIGASAPHVDVESLLAPCVIASFGAVLLAM